MCSDGLTNMVSDEQICQSMKESPTTAPEKLIELANQAGGYDNITVITIL